MSYCQSIYHIVFRTYRSEPTINIQSEKDFYGYLYTVATHYHAKVLRIGGMPDHVHLLVNLPSSISVSSFMQTIKTVTSKWLKDNPAFPHFKGWAREYAALSYSIKEVPNIVNYITNQKEHHKRFDFSSELRTLLIANGIEIDDKYWLQD